MRLRMRTFVLLTLVIAAPRTMLAQVGSFDDRTEYAVVTGQSHDLEHGPLLAVVLWRGEPGWMKTGSGEAHSEITHVDGRSPLPAERVSMSFSASGNVHGVVDRNYSRLTIEGREFALAPSDSALVVMVAVPSRGRARVVSTARMSATLPPEYWPKSWRHGDTTFMVRPQFARMHDMLLGALRQSPAVAAFLR